MSQHAEMSSGPTTSAIVRSAAAERMHAHRERRRKGLRCFTLETRAREIDVLVRRAALWSLNVASGEQRTFAAEARGPHSARLTLKRHGDSPLHSITSSAIESRLSEIFSPSAFAVLRLITSSNLID